MLSVENDTMLIVIYIRGILEAPLSAVYRYRYDSVVFPCRMIGAACVPLILAAELALRITALLGKLCGGNRLRVLLRLGQIDCDINIAILRLGYPLHILAHTVSSYIIRITAELIVIIRSFLRRNCIFLLKCLYNL